MGPALTPDRPHPGAVSRIAVIAVAAILAGAALVWHSGVQTPTALGAGRTSVSIVAGSPATLDPARAGDAGSSAIIAQLFESLTAFDAGLNLRPALAESWQVLDGGRTIVFRLRPDLTFSDGSALDAPDVVRSWLRLVNPANPSPLASLMADVDGAMAYARGELHDPAQVGLAADGRTVRVRLSRPTADFAAIVASPTFAIVPPSADGPLSPFVDASFVGSGAYRLAGDRTDGLDLAANERYWAGPPPIRTIHLVNDLGGRSPVDAFGAGEIDYTPIGDADAGWIAYDATLGPQLRSVRSLSVDYYGFDTSRPPFDDVRVRRAFALGVDWDRIVSLAAPESASVATSMVPPGVPGRSAKDFGQHRDVPAAQAALAEAGYPGGVGFPEVALVSGGGGYDGGIVAQLHDALGITLRVETMDFGEYFDRLATDPPAMWSLSWIADYPGANDFLGILLGSRESNNYSKWSSPEFDAAVLAAGQATSPTDARTAFDRAEAIVQHDVPVIPVSYGTGWALARQGLLGAETNGLGILRMAGLAWGEP